MRSIAFVVVCAIVFIIPWEEMAMLTQMETLSKSLGYLAVALSLIAVMLQMKIRRPPLAFLVLTLAVVWNWLSVAWSIEVEMSLSRMLTYLSLLAFAWMIWEFADSEKRLLWLFRCYVFGCCLSVGTMLASFVPGATNRFGGVERLTGGDLNENDIAAVLNIAIPIAVYLATQTARGKRMRMIYWAFVPLAAIGVLLTASRAGIVVLGGGLSLVAVTVLAKGFRLLVPFAVVIGVGVWLLPRFVSEKTFERVAQGTESNGFRDRILLWEVGLERWQKCPIQGAGAGSYRRVTELGGAPDPNVAHNTFVTILVEGGIVGASLMLAFYALVLRAVLKLPRNQKLLWLTVFAIWGASSMSLSWEYRKPTWLLYGAVMAACALPEPNSVRRMPVTLQQRRPALR